MGPKVVACNMRSSDVKAAPEKENSGGGGGGEGAVTSVNGKTGAVILDADDIGALPISATAEAEDSFSATRAYTTGELVFIAGGLYKVTAPVVAGDALVEGTNIRAVTLSQLLNDSAILLNPANGGIVPSSKMTLIPGNFFINVKNGYASLTMRIKVNGTWTANQPNIVATLPQSTIDVIGQTSVGTLCKIGDSQIGTVNINTWGGGNTISVTPPSVPASGTEVNAAFITFPVT